MKIRAGLFLLGLFLSGPAFASGMDAHDRALALERAGKLVEAVVVMHQAVKEEPDNPLFLATLGHFEYNIGQFDNALTHAIAALKVKPMGWYYVVAARAAFALGKFPESRQFAKQACDFGKDLLGAANYTSADEILHQNDPYHIKLSWIIPADRFVRQGNGHTVTIAVPPDKLPYQTTKVFVNNGRITRVHLQEDNRLLDVFADSPDHVELVTLIDRAPLDQSAALSDKDGAIPDDVKEYLNSSHKINLDSSALKSIAAGQKGATTAETVRNILVWMNGHLKYLISEFTDADEVVERGYGECWGWSSVFTALCRLNGIPARNVWGMVNTPGFAPEGYLKGHTWAEFYVPGRGWVEVEPQFPGLLGTIPSHYLHVAHDLKDGWGPVKNLPDTAQILERTR